MTVKRARPIAQSHPCVFKGAFIREQVDPQVKILWARRFRTHAPFGSLRLSFREKHCATLNPYESAFCPYPERECANEFLECVRATLDGCHDARGATGYFRSVAHTRALDRADNKPLSRDRDETKLDQTQGDSRQGDARDEGGGPATRSTAGDGTESNPAVLDGDGVRRRLSRPEHIGSVLGSFDFRPRPRSTDDGETRPER